MEKHELIIVGGSLGGIQSVICAQKHHQLTDAASDALHKVH